MFTMRTSSISLESEMTPVELSALVELISQKGFRGKHLEIGTAAGGTFCKMFLAATHNPEFAVIDTFEYFPNQLEAFCENLRKHGIDRKKIDIRRSTSSIAYLKSKKTCERFDFILIDGSHKFFYLNQDLRWANLLNSGGVFAIHDYSINFESVKKPVDYFIRKNLNYKEEFLKGSLLVLKKNCMESGRGVVTIPSVLARVLHLKMQFLRNIKKHL